MLRLGPVRRCIRQPPRPSTDPANKQPVPRLPDARTVPARRPPWRHTPAAQSRSDSSRRRNVQRCLRRRGAFVWAQDRRHHHLLARRLLGGRRPTERSVLWAVAGHTQLLELLHISGLHPAISAAPPVPSRLSNLQLPQHRTQLLTRVQTLLALTQLPHSLLRCMTFPLHCGHPPILRESNPQHMGPNQGPLSSALERDGLGRLDSLHWRRSQVTGLWFGDGNS